MYEAKTREHDGSVDAFLDAIEDETKRTEAHEIRKLMERVTGRPAKMWGPSIVGFGKYHYKYATGHEGDSSIAGFSPRARNFSLYIMAGFDGYDELLSKLGKHKHGKTCLYINKLSDVDKDVLEELIRRSVAWMRENYETD